MPIKRCNAFKWTMYNLATDKTLIRNVSPLTRYSSQLSLVTCVSDRCIYSSVSSWSILIESLIVVQKVYILGSRQITRGASPIACGNALQRLAASFYASVALCMYSPVNEDVCLDGRKEERATGVIEGQTKDKKDKWRQRKTNGRRKRRRLDADKLKGRNP